MMEHLVSQDLELLSPELQEEITRLRHKVIDLEETIKKNEDLIKDVLQQQQEAEKKSSKPTEEKATSSTDRRGSQ